MKVSAVAGQTPPGRSHKGYLAVSKEVGEVTGDSQQTASASATPSGT